MEQYIFIRNYGDKVKPGDRLVVDSSKATAYRPNGKKISAKIKYDDPLLKLSILKIDKYIFVAAFNSQDFSNWINERRSYIDENDNKPMVNLVKKMQLTLLYLSDIGLTSDTITLLYLQAEAMQ